MENVYKLNQMNEDTELQRLQEMHEEDGGTQIRVPQTFTLSDNQVKWITEWQREQIQRSDPYMGTVGFRFKYEFTQYSIGSGLTVTDLLTEEFKDFTDYDLW